MTVEIATADIPLKAWWTGGYNNWGDIITPVILGFLSGRPVERKYGDGCIFSAGSILHNVRSGCCVWGSGLLSPKDLPKPFPANVTFHSVRGPLTRDALIQRKQRVPKIYGDPALLLPFLYESHSRPTTTVGIIPHYSHLPAIGKTINPGDVSYKIINVLGGFWRVLHEVLDCETILSSSLHGIILAEAYKKKTAWLQPKVHNRARLDRFKFDDYFFSTQRKHAVPNNVDLSQPIDVEHITWLDGPTIDLQPLLESCPFSKYKKLADIPTQTIQYEQNNTISVQESLRPVLFGFFERNNIAPDRIDSEEHKRKEESPQPLVSIIISCQKDTHSLAQLLYSIFLQEHRPMECLICERENGSQTKDLIASLKNACPCEITLKHVIIPSCKHNKVIVNAISESQGEFICYLDSDDLLTSESISERVRILVANDEIDFCYGLHSVRNQDGIDLHYKNKPWPLPGEPRLTVPLFGLNGPLIRRKLICQLAATQDGFETEGAYYTSRLKYNSEHARFIDSVLTVHIQRNNDWKPVTSEEHLLAQMRDLHALRELLMQWHHNTAQERLNLASQFKSLAKAFYNEGDYRNARSLILQSLKMHWTIRTTGYWVLCVLLDWFREEPRLNIS